MVGYHHEAINGRELTTTEHSEAGLASGIVTRLIIQPLDVLKIRFQLQEEPIRGNKSGKYKGIFQSMRLILREEGYGALWKGHVPAQGLSAMYGLVQFSSFEFLSSIVASRLSPKTSDFLCGSLAGCVAMTWAMPLDVIRTRLVSQGNQGVVYRGTLHASRHIWKREGIQGYFRGWVPSIVQIAPFTGLQFTFYNAFNELWNSIYPNFETTGVLFSGATAGTVAKTILYPLDMIRHRLQMNGFERKGFGKASRYQHGMLKAMAHVIKHETPYGLFKGLWPSQIKAAANSGCAFLFYELFCLIVSFQSICFTVSKLVFGIAVDKFPPVVILLFGLAIASTASILLAYAQSFSALLFAVLAIGSVQGAAWIPATKLVAQWYEGPSFGTMFSLLGCGSTLSGLLLPLLGDFYWRDVSLFLGCASLAFGLFSFYFLRTDYSCSVAVTKNHQMSSNFWKIVSSVVIWNISMSYFFTLEARTVSETWLPLYLEDKQLPVSCFLVAYETAGLVGTMFSGFLLNQVTYRLSEESARRIVGVTLSVGMLISYMLSTSFPQHYISFGVLCGFFTNASLNIWCLIASFAGEQHIAGSANAFISFLANFGPIFAGSPLSLLISSYGYSVFVPFFAIQVVLLLAISYMQIPLKMEAKTKKE